ncbi:TIGR04388 family protein [Leptospira levettii]|uniref:TIGR04388 family protein n=1 Tax=Leptospira levettii TaxID=2023178 RepID=UPI001082B75E|nr:TIGR04388 family protein [Leptospira levettii]TGL22097.1 TIGR04388 family protein [Leptospira levettii]
MKKLNAKSNHFNWISLFWKKSNQRYTSAVLIFTYLLTFFSPIFTLSAQVAVPVLNNQQFQNQDLMEAYAIADRQATSVEHWDTLVNSYLYNLYTNWQEAADAKITEFVAAVNTSDAYNSVEAYKEYVYNGLQSQKAILEQNWMEEAETSIQLRRESFLLSNTLSTYNSVEVNSTQTQTNLGTNPNQNVIDQAQEAVRIAREQWEREHANAVASGLFQYELAIGSADRTYDNLVSQIATTESQFLTQLENLRTYENNVRTQISTKVNQLQAYLASNSVFYQTDANGTPIIDNNHLTSDGQNLKSLMTQMQDAIANKSSLTTISGMLKDYLAAQESVAASNKAYWQGRVYGVSDLNNIISAANVGNNYLSDGVIAAIKSYYDNGNDVNALKSFINQKLGLNTNFKYVQSISSIDIVGISSNYNPYPVTIGSGGVGESYSSVGDAAFTYWATGCGYWGVFLCITQDFQEESVRTKLEFTLYDANADSNASAWGSYSTSLDGMVTTWGSSVIPAISNWESQVSLYASQYAAWKAQSESILAEAALTRDAEVSGISEARANWLSKMNALQQSGEVVWGTVESSLSEKANSIQEAVKNGISGQELANFISNKASDLTEILSVLPQKSNVELDTTLIQTAGLQAPQVSDSFFTAANNSFLTDLGSIQQFMQTLDKSFTGAQNLALANSMNTLAENATTNGMSQVYNSLTAAGLNVSYNSQGNLVVTQSIYNGQANLREGADATSASSYDAGMSNYSTVVVAPESFKLANTGGLFDTWENSSIFNEFQSNSSQFSASFNQATAAMTASLNEVGKMNERGAEAFQASANSQANTAQMIKSLAETLATGGTVQSWAKSQAEGYVKSQVAEAISRATGGAVSADLIVAFLNKRQADKAKKEAARKKTIQTVATVVAVAAAVVVTVCTAGAGVGPASAGASAVAGGGGTAAAATTATVATTSTSIVGSIGSAVVSSVASAASAVGTFVTTTLPTFVASLPSMAMSGISAVMGSGYAMTAVAVNTVVQTAAGYELGGMDGAAAGFVNGVAVSGAAFGVGFNVTENNGSFGASLGVVTTGGVTAGVGITSNGVLSGNVGYTVVGGGTGPSPVSVNLNSNGEYSGNVNLPVPYVPEVGFGASFGSGQATEVTLVGNVGNGTAVQVGTGGVGVATTVGNAVANVGVDFNGNVSGGVTFVNSPTTNYGVSFGTGEPTVITVNTGNTNAVLGPDGLEINSTAGGATTVINVNADGEFSGNVTSGTAGVTYGVSFGSGEGTTVVATDGTTSVQVGPDGASLTSTAGGVATSVSLDSNGNVSGSVDAGGTTVGVGPNGVSVTTEIDGDQVSVDSNGNTTINGSTPEELINSIDLTNPLTYGITQEAFADLTAGLAIDEVNGFIDFLNSYPGDLAAIGLSGMLGAYLLTIGRKEEEEYEFEENEDEEGSEEVSNEEYEDSDYEEGSIEDSEGSSEEGKDTPTSGSNGDVVVTERGDNIKIEEEITLIKHNSLDFKKGANLKKKQEADYQAIKVAEKEVKDNIRAKEVAENKIKELNIKIADLKKIDPKDNRIVGLTNELNVFTGVKNTAEAKLKSDPVKKAKDKFKITQREINDYIKTYEKLPTNDNEMFKEASSRKEYDRFMNLTLEQSNRRNEQIEQEKARSEAALEAWKVAQRERDTADKELIAEEAKYKNTYNKNKEIIAANKEYTTALAAADKKYKEIIQKKGDEKVAKAELEKSKIEAKKELDKTIESILKNNQELVSAKSLLDTARSNATAKNVAYENAWKDEQKEFEVSIQRSIKESHQILDKFYENKIKLDPSKKEVLLKELNAQKNKIIEKYKVSYVIGSTVGNDIKPDLIAKFTDPIARKKEWVKKNITYINTNKEFADLKDRVEVKGNQMLIKGEDGTQSGVINLGTESVYQFTKFEASVLVVSDKAGDPFKWNDETGRYEYIQNGSNTCQTYTLAEQMQYAGIKLRDSGRSIVQELAKLELEQGLTGKMSTKTIDSYNKILEPYGYTTKFLPGNSLEDHSAAIKAELLKGNIVNSGLDRNGPIKSSAGIMEPQKDSNGDLKPRAGHRVNIVGYDDEKGEWIVNDSANQADLIRIPYGDYELGKGWSEVLVKLR